MKIGLVLSGGGTRGAGHLVVIQFLNECNIPIHFISGTSAGALVGAFIANNYTPSEVLKITEKIKLFDWHTLSIGSLGLLKMNSIEKILKEYLPENFEDLKIPLYVCATDIINNQTKYFHTGHLITPLIASSSIPVLYEPVQYQNTFFVDGGVLNNLPIEPIRDKCDVIIAVHVNHLSKHKKEIRLKDIIERSFHLSINQSVYLKQHSIDIFIDPPNMSQFSMFDIKIIEQVFEYAYQHTLSMKNEILQRINDYAKKFN